MASNLAFKQPESFKGLINTFLTEKLPKLCKCSECCKNMCSDCKDSDFKYKIQIYYSSGELYASSDIISPNQTTEYTYSSLKIENNYFNSIIDTDVSTFKVKLTTYQSDGTTEIGSNELNNISVSSFFILNSFY